MEVMVFVPLILRLVVVNSFDATLALSVVHVLAFYGSGLNRERESHLDLEEVREERVSPGASQTFLCLFQQSC